MFYSKTAEYGCSDAAEVTLQIPSDALLLGLIAGNFGLSARSAAESTSPAFPLQALPSQRNLLACPLYSGAVRKQTSQAALGRIDMQLRQISPPRAINLSAASAT